MKPCKLSKLFERFLARNPQFEAALVANLAPTMGAGWWGSFDFDRTAPRTDLLIEGVPIAAAMAVMTRPDNRAAFFWARYARTDRTGRALAALAPAYSRPARD